jgi:hydrogenase nickel incorporation protein HypA/HybF
VAGAGLVGSDYSIEDPMHEMSVALSLHERCRILVEQRGGGHLEIVRVAVGQLSTVEPELLRFAWQAITEGSADADAQLDIDWRPARLHCGTCGADKPSSPDGWPLLCPDCGTPLRVHGGTELDLLQLSFATDEHVSVHL